MSYINIIPKDKQTKAAIAAMISISQEGSPQPASHFLVKHPISADSSPQGSCAPRGVLCAYREPSTSPLSSLELEVRMRTLTKAVSLHYGLEEVSALPLSSAYTGDNLGQRAQYQLSPLGSNILEYNNRLQKLKLLR